MSWILLFLIGQSLVSVEMLRIEDGLFAKVFCSLVLPLVLVYDAIGAEGTPLQFLLATFSGILLHVTFWAVLYALMNRRAE